MKKPTREIVEIQATIGFQTQKLRVAAYARVSSASEEQLNSFENQITHYTKFITSQDDWEFVEVYSDEGVSGISMDKREDFQRMLKDCREGKIDRIITKSTSRFARNTVDTVSTLRELKELGISVYFEKEGIDTSKMSGENLVTLYALFAQEESLAISTNCKRGIRMRMKNGTYHASIPPYGYKILDGQLIVKENEAKIVQRIFKEYLSGKGCWLISEDLNKEQIPWKKNENGWHRNTITVILKNHRYKGDSLWQKTFTQDILPYKRQKNEGELPQYYIHETHEPITSPIQYELANLLMKERSKTINSSYEQLPLTKKIRCKHCDSHYSLKKTRGIYYWSCRKHLEKASNCGSKRIPEEKIYQAFIMLYNKLRSNYQEILVPMGKHLEKLQELGQRENMELKELNLQMSEILEQKMTITSLMSAGILDSTLFIAQSDTIEKQLTDAKKKKKLLLKKLKNDNYLEKTEDLIALLEESSDFMEQFDQEIFEEMVDYLLAFDGDTIEFVLCNGLKLTERIS